MVSETLRRPNFAVLLGVAWLLAAFHLLWTGWAATGHTMPDADDAMRLVQMRAFLAGQGWFDLHEARIAPPFGYDSHWSRLIDVGLAGVFLVFTLFFDQAFAERLLRAVWPLLWVLPTMAGVAAIAWKLAGREAALVALVLAVVGVPAYQQFYPGRIDHHNVQIALAILTVAATVWSDRARWCAAAAGVLTGLALAVGLESLAYLAMCGAAIGVRYVLDMRGAAALRAYGVALAGATLAAFLVNIDPAHWTSTACDAIAINTAAAVVVGGIGLAIAGSVSGERTALRAMTVACAGAAALALFVLVEPRCLGGPFAMVDRTLWSVWLTDVREMQPLMRMFARMPVTVVAMAAFPAAALVAAVVLARRPTLRRDFAFLVSVAALLFAAVAMVLTIRVFSYAMWLGMPLVAAAALRLAAVLRLRSRPARFTAVLLLTPTALSVGAMTIADAAGLNDSDSFAPPENRPCFALASYAPLARLPPGLIVTDVRYGPYVLALTPHSVLAAPYHRLAAAIIANQKALVAPVDQARRLLVAAGATYVAVCGPRPPSASRDADQRGSLWAQLHAGAVPSWLEPALESGSGTFTLYRVRP
jgi:hypothetical protein